MACEGCEERRRKIKAMYDNSMQSITSAIARLANRDSKAKSGSNSAKQSADSAVGDTEQSDTRTSTASRSRAGRAKQ